MEDQDNKPAIFSPLTVTWLISGILGVVFPLFGQEIIAEQLSKLSLLPASTDTANLTVDPAAQVMASSILFGALAVYLIAISFQIYFIAKTLKIRSIFALAFTLVVPLFIWFTLPYILIQVA